MDAMPEKLYREVIVSDNCGGKVERKTVEYLREDLVKKAVTKEWKRCLQIVADYPVDCGYSLLTEQHTVVFELFRALGGKV